MELAQRVAIVTGASRGIGRAAAEALALAGADVVMTGRSEAEGAAAAAAINKAGKGGAAFLRQDVMDDSSWRDVFAAAEARGGLSVFVANAGIAEAKLAVDLSLADFRKTIAVNLRAVFIGVRYAAAAMRAHGRGGSIILMSSIVGKIGAPGYIHYAAAKGGLRLMAKAAALELGSEKIRVNSIHPGFIRTDMTKPFPEAQFATLVPLGRFGETDEIASSVLFLASDRSRFMTGAELVVDGGASVR